MLLSNFHRQPQRHEAHKGTKGDTLKGKHETEMYVILYARTFLPKQPVFETSYCKSIKLARHAFRQPRTYARPTMHCQAFLQPPKDV